MKIEVSQIAGGGHSVRVLKGDAVVQSPLRTIRLETGTGVILRDESVPGEVHELVDPPLLVYPEPYHTIYNVTSIPLRWTPVDGALSYDIEIASDPDFTDILDRQSAGPGDADLESDVSNGKYYWRVRAIDSRNVPGLPAVGIFRISIDHDPPKIVLKTLGPWEN